MLIPAIGIDGASWVSLAMSAFEAVGLICQGKRVARSFLGESESDRRVSSHFLKLLRSKMSPLRSAGQAVKGVGGLLRVEEEPSQMLPTRGSPEMSVVGWGECFWMHMGSH